MKKIINLFVILGFIFIPNLVDAATTMPEAVNGTITLTEDVTLTSTFTVSDGEDITLNLNGFTLTTSSGTVIKVEEGGKLTITGNGTVTNGSDEYALQTYGNLTIENGTYNGQIVVDTMGSLEINGGTFVGPTGTPVTICVYGNAVINDGEFTSGSSNVVYGTADSNIEINGGTFISKGINYPTFYIYGNLVINAGEFTGESSVVVYGRNGSNIEINNGKFTSGSSNAVYGTADSNIEINDGTFIGADNGSPVVSTYGTMIINDGDFTNQVVATGNSSLEINGGTYYAYLGSTAFMVTSNATLTINDGTISCLDSMYAVRTQGVASITGGTINGRISVESDGTLEITGGTFSNSSTDEDYNYLISNTSSNVVAINEGTFTYPSVLLSSSSTNEITISGEVIGPLDLVNYAISGTIITLNTSVDSDDTLDIPDCVKVLVPPTVSFKIKDITGDGTIDVTDDNYEIVYVDGYYIMRLKEVVEESNTTNPNTGISSPYLICLSVLIISIILIVLSKKKRYI